MLADACHAVERGYALHDAPSSSDPESSRALFAEAQAQALKLIDGCEEEVGAAESPALQALLWCLRGKAMTLGEEGRGSLEEARASRVEAALAPIAVADGRPLASG